MKYQTSIFTRAIWQTGMLMLSLSPALLTAQHQDLAEAPAAWKGRREPSADTSSFLHACKTGHFQGHFRSYCMSTDNSGPLTDYYALAAGAGLRYETAPWHHFQVTMSGFFILNVASSDFTQRDSLTGQGSRYELGLFDIENPANKSDIDRLEELMVSYRTAKGAVSLGRMHINTPFVNLQDGRMRPTLVSGLWLESRHIPRTRVQGGWLAGVSPRSTVRWYRMGESIGVYPTGVQPDGQPSRYAGLLESRGVALLGITSQPLTRLQVQGWGIWIENIAWTGLTQAEYQVTAGKPHSWKVAGQALVQAGTGGGGLAAAETYIAPGTGARAWGGRLSWSHGPWEAYLAYTRITDHGRYLMPREWGRDPFFTFLPRERNEGLGDVHATTAQLQRRWTRLPLRTTLATGAYRLPDVRRTDLNKYGLPSYWQTHLDLRYTFGGSMEGLDAQLLLVHKAALGKDVSGYRYIFNKVDMFLYHAVLNYHF
ncbi:MAG: OprD family outer membrane porin [Bacteroidia bacterium]|nr:OprD family outer membrane porin [Bacteroidia bacterium]